MAGLIDKHIRHRTTPVFGVNDNRLPAQPEMLRATVGHLKTADNQNVDSGYPQTVLNALGLLRRHMDGLARALQRLDNAAAHGVPEA